MHAQQHAKKYFKFFNASDQAELRPNPCRTRHQAGRWCTRLQILLSACQISKSQNFHNFLNFHQPKGCFLSDRQKSPEFYPIKKVFFSKRVQLLKKRKKSDTASQHRRPQKGQKSRFFFANFFCIFGSACSMRFKSAKDSWFGSEYLPSYDPKRNRGRSRLYGRTKFGNK